MNAVVIDFFEWKYNHRIIRIKNMMDRYRDYLDMELAEAMRKDAEELTGHE